MPGQDGQDGVNCYDQVGDVNEDGELTAADCIGATGPKGDVGPQGPAGQDASTPEKSVSFSGFFFLENDGYIELIEKADGTYNILSQRISSTNLDSSYALHPNLPTSNLKQIGDEIYGTYKPTYNDTTHHVIDDKSSSLIDEKRTTTYSITIDNDTLIINLYIYNDSGIYVTTERAISEIK